MGKNNNNSNNTMETKIIGISQNIRNIKGIINQVADTELNILVCGETGVGKDLIVHNLYQKSNRVGKPFVKVNCAALPDTLLESEMFGYERGAFTGAQQKMRGKFEQADGGVLFLDEIGDIPLATQVKLLRVLEEKEIERVGDHKPIRIDVRIISATNKHLEDLIAQGAFREDLFFRINVFPLNMPPLSARSDDLPLLVQHFITLNNARGTKQIDGLTPAAIAAL